MNFQSTPPMTEEKQDLLTQSSTPIELFHQEIVNGVWRYNLKSGQHNNTMDNLWESYDEWQKNGGYDDRLNKTTFSKSIRKKMGEKLVNASTNRAGGCKLALSLPE